MFGSGSDVSESDFSEHISSGFDSSDVDSSESDHSKLIEEVRCIGEDQRRAGADLDLRSGG